MKMTVVGCNWDESFSSKEAVEMIMTVVNEMGNRHFINTYFHLECEANIVFVSDFVLTQGQMDDLWNAGDFYLANKIFEGPTFENLLTNIHIYITENGFRRFI